jgi:hypothetical protein
MDEKCGWMYFVSADIGIPSVLPFLRFSLRAEPNESPDLRTKTFARPSASQRRLHAIEITSHNSIVFCTRLAHVLSLLLSRSYQRWGLSQGR